MQAVKGFKNIFQAHDLSISIRYLDFVLFYHFKSYFIYYTILFNNIIDILTFILPYNSLKYIILVLYPCDARLNQKFICK